MKNYFKYFGFLIIICVYFSCTKNTNKSNVVAAFSDSILFYQLLQKGDSIYALKNGYEAFAESMKRFDSANEIAKVNNNPLMTAEATFAIGRIYDAWNKEPLQTIVYFKKAAESFKNIANQEKRYFYANVCLTNAYCKNKDSAGAVGAIVYILNEIKLIENRKLDYSFLGALMLYSTDMNDFKLANKINTIIENQYEIKNDINTLNFKDFYYIAKSRVYIKKENIKNPYIDSLIKIFANTKTAYDSIFYSNELYLQFNKINDIENSFKYLEINKEKSLKTFTAYGISTMKNVLMQAEINAAQKQKEIDKERKKRNETTIWILGSFATIVTFLSMALFKRNQKYKIQSEALLTANKKLDDKIAQNEVLNKEIHHRVKNNLQMIFSLLQMQERSTENEETILHLQAARNRIESIASLHEQLMNNNTGTETNYKLHVTQLINGVLESVSSEKKIISNLNIDDVMMPVSQSFALSLILNEWITNTVKYAKGENNVLEIFIGLKTLNDGIIITYSDNGKLNKDVLRKDGLGTNIVSLLCKQMKGQLTTLNNNLFNYHLLIPKNLTV